MLKLALIGQDVENSLSPRMHAFLLQGMGENCRYELVSVPPEAFPAALNRLFSDFDAFNVTIPYKLAVCADLHSLSEEAERIGSVNAVLSRERKGFNTDGGGFSLMLRDERISVAGKTALVLGAGGAGRSVIRRLAAEGAEVFVYERRAERLFEVFRALGGFTPLTELSGRTFDFIVNCTGVGMHGTVGKLPSVCTERGEEPFPAWLWEGCGAAVDLIYEPERSAFLQAAEAAGVRAVNGHAMLFYQAYLSDCIFSGRAPDFAQAHALYQTYRENCQ